MYYMELALISGENAGCWTSSEYHAYNWFFSTACRKNVSVCKVYKQQKGKNHMITVLRYRRPKDEELD